MGKFVTLGEVVADPYEAQTPSAIDVQLVSKSWSSATRQACSCGESTSTPSTSNTAP